MDIFKALGLLAISFIFILNSSFAIDIDACKKMTSHLAKLHKEDGEGIKRDMQESIRDIEKNQKLSADTLAEIIKVTKINHDFDKNYQKNVTDIMALIHNIPYYKADQIYCNKEGSLERISKVKLKKMREISKTIIDDIELNFSLLKLNKNEGLAIIAVFSQGKAELIDLAEEGGFQKPLKIGPLNDNQYFKVIKLKQGNYYWNRVINHIPNSDSRIISGELQPGAFEYFELSKQNYKFHIDAGKINFTGVLMMDFQGNRVSSDLYDRSTIVIKMLQQQYPYLQDRFPIIDGFNQDDSFISFYLSEKRKLSSTTRKGN